MKKGFLKFAFILLSAAVVLSSCDEKVVVDPDAAEKDAPNEVIVKADITGTRNWVKDSVTLSKDKLTYPERLTLLQELLLKVIK